MHAYGKNIKNTTLQELLKADGSYWAQILYLPKNKKKYIDAKING